MKRVVGLIGALVVVGCLGAMWATAAPQPKTIPTEWELDFAFETPMPIQVQVPGETTARTYWYVLYSVTNNTDEDRVFVPRVTLFTDTGQVRYGSEGIYPAVFSAIQARHNNPYLKDLASITGKLLQGADNAKDGVAIFQDFDPKARAVDLFVGGLSGETAVVKLPKPVTVDETDIRGQTKKVTRNQLILHKTRQLRYNLPGEAAARFRTPATLDVDTWVMR